MTAGNMDEVYKFLDADTSLLPGIVDLVALYAIERVTFDTLKDGGDSRGWVIMFDSRFRKEAESVEKLVFETLSPYPSLIKCNYGRRFNTRRLHACNVHNVCTEMNPLGAPNIPTADELKAVEDVLSHKKDYIEYIIAHHRARIEAHNLAVKHPLALTSRAALGYMECFTLAFDRPPLRADWGVDLGKEYYRAMEVFLREFEERIYRRYAGNVMM